MNGKVEDVVEICEGLRLLINEHGIELVSEVFDRIKEFDEDDEDETEEEKKSGTKINWTKEMKKDLCELSIFEFMKKYSDVPNLTKNAAYQMRYYLKKQ